MHSDVLVVLLISVIAAVFAVYHKLSSALQHIRHEAARHASNVIAQVEALLSIHAELRPQHALPKSRGWAASPDFLAVLISLANDRRPCTVLECSSGYSTLVLAAVMRNQGKGHVYSLEHDEAFAEHTRRSLAIHGLADWATVLSAPLIPCEIDDWTGRWCDLSGLPADLAADMLVVDGPPQHSGAKARYPAIPCLQRVLSSGSVIALDDAAREDEEQIVALWLARYPKLSSLRAPSCEKGCSLLLYL